MEGITKLSNWYPKGFRNSQKELTYENKSNNKGASLLHNARKKS